MLTALGLDLSYTGTGIVAVRNRRAIYRRLVSTFADEDDDMRRDYIARNVAAAVKYAKPDLTVVEGYSFGKKFGGERLGELGGVVKHTLWKMKALYVELPNLSLQSFALGRTYRSHEAKAKMIEAARLARFLTTDDNLADGYWLARWGIDNYDTIVTT